MTQRLDAAWSRPSAGRRIDAGRLIAYAALFAGSIDCRGASARLRPVWRRPTPELRAFQLSPTGQAVAVTTRDGRVACVCLAGTDLWTVRYPGTVLVRVSSTGEFGLIADSSRTGPSADYLRSGKLKRRVRLDSVATCSALAPDGDFGAIATSHGWLYLFRRQGDTVGCSRQRLPQAPRTMLCPRSGLLLIGYKGVPGVVALGIDGRSRWRLPGEPGRVYDLFSGPNSHSIGITSYFEQRGDGARAYVLASSGSMIWHARVPGVYPRLALGADGARAVVGFTEILQSHGRTGALHKIAFYDAVGRRLWEEGGFFFSPRLLGTVTPGSLVVARGPGADFYLLGDRGRMESHYRQRAATIGAQASWDGRTVMAWGQDASLHLLRVVNGP